MDSVFKSNRRSALRPALARVAAYSAGMMILGSVVHAQPSDRRAAVTNDSFHWLNEQNKASVIMLVEEGIISKELGTQIAGSLTQVIADGTKPGVDDLDDVYRYDVDDLKLVVDANLRERAREAQRAEALIEREVAKFVARQGDVEVIPTIVSLRARVEEIRLGEVRKTLARLPDAAPETRAAIEALSPAMVNKILHAPITRLRESSRAGASRSWLELVHDLFGLGRRG